MADFSMVEGKIMFDVPKAGKPCHTYYKVIGSLDSNKIPLIVLHGGPGAGYEYLFGLADLTIKSFIPIVFYDQIGTGRSTYLPEKRGDIDFWVQELFHNELDNLIDNLNLREKGFDLIGQSWGGMIASEYAARSSQGLRKLILSSAPASIELYTESQKRLKRGLPQDVQDIMDKHEREGVMGKASPEFIKAKAQFYQRHLCQCKPWPAPEVVVELKWMIEEDPTVYDTLYGLSALTATGTLKNWTIIEHIPEISVSTLLINGADDVAQDSCIEPFFRLLPKVKWITIQNASHLIHVEQREQFMKVVGDFLNS